MSSKRKLEEKYSNLISKLENIQQGEYSVFVGNRPTSSSMTESGYSVFLDQNKAKSITPKTRKIVSMSPEATVLVKKKAFATLGGYNDLRFMDKTEKMLLRATKALFAYKVAQIRAYESLTKFENYLDTYREVHLGLLAEALDQTKYMVSGAQGVLGDRQASELNKLRFTLSDWNTRISSGDSLTFEEQEQYEADKKKFEELTAKANDTTNIDDYSSLGSAFNSFGNLINGTLEDLDYEAYRDDVLALIKRNAFSADSRLTTWIVDPDNPDNYSTGPGTGVIEITTFSNFSTTCSIGQANISGASITLEDPYRVMTVTDDDIELAIDEAVKGTVGLFNDFFNGGMDVPPLDTSSMISSALEMAGIGDMDDSLDIDRVRDRLKTFYLGKPFINPADGIHFYIRGNRTKQDFSSQFGSVWGDSSEDISSFDETYLAIDDSVLEAERRLYTSGKIDFDSYKKVRTYSDNSFGMMHVFGGYVTTTSENYSNGKWTLSISCVDNMGWLDWSKYVENPSLQDAKGVLEDPLTPYKLKVDDSGRVVAEEGPELLSENKTLLQSGLLSYGSGLLTGETASEDNLVQGQFSGSGSLYGTGILQHPNGFVYRWKDGIITATTEVTVIDEKSTNLTNLKTFTQGYALAATDTPLSNLDVANILSLLIVGEPYNIETYMEQTLEAMTRKETSGLNLNPADPLTSIIESTRRQNTFYGNFKPYRRITMSNAVANKISSDSIMRSQVNSTISALQTRRGELKAQRNRIMTSDEKLVSGTKSAQSIESTLLANALDVEIDSIGKGIEQQLALIDEGGIFSSSYGLTVDFNLTADSKFVNLSEDLNEDPSITKAISLVGAQRRIEDVRLNRDKNLFVISDQYDNNTDIRPFLLKLRDSGWNLFDASYASVLERCKAACSYINFEFFCNSQGHLEFRPPQWNKTPLTVLERLFELNNEKKVIPDFLTNVFQTRTDSLRLEIHSLNIQIVIIALLLNKYPDKSLIPGIGELATDERKGSGRRSLEFFGVRLSDSGGLSLGGPTSGISKALFGEGEKSNFSVGSGSEDNTGSGISLNVSWSDDGDVLYGDTETILGEFDAIFQETTVGGAGIGIYDGVLNAVKLGSGPVNDSTISSPGSLTSLRNNFRKNYGLDPARGLGISEKGFSIENFVVSLPDSDKLTRTNFLFQKLSNAISERDSLVTILKRNTEKLEELEQIESIVSGEFTDASSSSSEPDFEVEFLGINLNDTLDKVQNLKSLLTGDIDTDSSSSLDYLIENDERNLLGAGSGKRFIVNDEEIISASFTESPPDYTRIDVYGDAPLGLGDSLNKGMDGMYFWAGATDFDLWRQFGYKPGEIRLPFANDAELQSRPYAILQLQLERTKINKGNVTVAGNEFYQPGDVVYIPEKGLLYYIQQVSHSFAYGSSFQTTLDLSYGHPPGQYLPSPLDVIGGQLTKNPLGGRILTYRGQKEDDYYSPLSPDCSIVFPRDYDDNVAVLLSHRNNQERFFNMMLDLSTAVVGSRKILIRGFAQTEDEKTKVKKYISVIKQLFQNPVQITQTSPAGDLFDAAGISSLVNKAFGVGSGTSKGTAPLMLPNGLQATPIDPSNIVEQVTIVGGPLREGFKTGGIAEISCMNRVLYATQTLDQSSTTLDDISLSGLFGMGGDTGGFFTEQDVVSIFPKDGPRQSTWLDIRDDLTQMSNIIEVGILNIPSSNGAS